MRNPITYLRRFLRRANRAVFRIRPYLTIVSTILAIVGVVTFAQFILEESVQLAIFASWKADQPQQLAEVADLVEGIDRKAAAINFWFGWINPLSRMSYDAFHRSTEAWVLNTRLKVLALDHTALAGKQLTFRFSPDRMDVTSEGAILSRGPLRIHCASAPSPSAYYEVTVAVAVDRVTATRIRGGEDGTQ